MTGTEYRTLHGDPATWTDREFDEFAQVASPGAPPPATVIAYIHQPPPNLPTTDTVQTAA
jgi:hypothetical protein